MVNVFVFKDFKITPDENTYLNQARIFAKGNLYGVAPQLPEFFEEPYLIHKEGRLFSIFQPGWSLLLAPAVKLGLQQCMPPLAGAFVLLAMFFLANRVAGSGVARGCVLIMLLSPFFIFNTATYYAHIAELLWISLFMLSFVKAREENQSALYGISGICLGAAFITRYFDLSFGVPFGLVLVWDAICRRQGSLKNIVLFVSPIFVFGASALLYQWLLTGDPLMAPYKVGVQQARYIYILRELDDPYHIYGFSNAFSPSMALARTVKKWMSLNVWIFPFALVFLVPLFIRPRRWEILFFLGCATLSLVYFPYFPTGGWEYGPRYYFPIFGCLSLLIARGMGALFSGIRKRWGEGRIFRALAYWLFFCMAINLCLCIAMGSSLRLVVRGFSDLDRIIAERHIEEGVVFITVYPDFFAHAGIRDTSREEQLRKDIPYYLIHNRADYGQPLLFVHSLGEKEDQRLRARFPGRTFYVFQANPFAAAFGTGRGILQRVEDGKTSLGKEAR
jgi:hypothetical protein